MIEQAKFLYLQQPAFWWVLGLVFFGLGLLYANVGWRACLRQLRRAQREQRSLLEERRAAIEDRQRRTRRRRTRQVADSTSDSATLSETDAQTAHLQIDSAKTQPGAAIPAVNGESIANRPTATLDRSRPKSIAELFSDSYASRP